MTREAGVAGPTVSFVPLSEAAKLLAVPLDEIAVIGGRDNDIAMFERSGLSISMGNTNPVGRGKDVVTDSNGEDTSLTRAGGSSSAAVVRTRRARRPSWDSRMVEPARAASKISLILAISLEEQWARP